MKTLLPVEATVHPVPWWLAVQVALALASSSEQHRFSSRSRVALGDIRWDIDSSKPWSRFKFNLLGYFCQVPIFLTSSEAEVIPCEHTSCSYDAVPGKRVPQNETTGAIARTVPQCPARATVRAERKDGCRCRESDASSEKCACALTPADPSNQSSDSSNRRNGKYPLGLAAKAAKATTIKEALARWEEKTSQKPSEAREIKLYAQIPPIEKMDASLSTLSNCEKLSLSTNCIEKIANLNGLKNLRILSLGRNNIKNLNGLEAVGDTLEELWISYNFIEKLKGIHVMKKLKILYMSNNLVKDWAEFVKLAELPCLEDLVFVGNPLEEKHSAEGNWVEEATKRVPKLKKLDGTPVIKEDEEEDN
ncbi:dynein axonemal light chain 1 [Capricornis sumatraensis]|uniref:dynein axonemal light chain 1 n=1 Tax=Capricornis sumatraensis TaxID=34865 RepID=UPI003605420F